MDFLLATFGVVTLLVILIILIWDKFLNKANGDYFSEEVKIIKEEKDRIFEEKVRLDSELEQKKDQISKLQNEIDNLRKENATLSERGKQAFAQNAKLDSEFKSLQKEREDLLKKLNKFESEKEQNENEYKQKIEKLENAREKLEKEQERVIKEDEEKRKKEKENRDRMWNEHENEVAEKMRESCRNPNIALPLFDNTNLPDGFHGNLKPDFLVEFLDQYIIFDAKKSRDLKNYLSDQAKKTAQKIKNNSQIFNMVFFVVPNPELSELKKTSFFEEGYSFFAVSSESLEPILYCFKKITEFENLENFDPQDREKIINVISSFDFHINFQNAVNLILAQRGINILENSKNLDKETLDEVENKKRNMRLVNLTPTELKKFIFDVHEQKDEVGNLISPKNQIDNKQLEDAKTLFEEKD